MNEERININPEGENDYPFDTSSVSKPIKVSDDTDSKEILVFTSSHNVYKVQKSEIRDKFQALQKIDLEQGEKPIYLTGEKKYTGFLICLLYTSPSPRDGLLSRMPSSA